MLLAAANTRDTHSKHRPLPCRRLQGTAATVWAEWRRLVPIQKRADFPMHQFEGERGGAVRQLSVLLTFASSLSAATVTLQGPCPRPNTSREQHRRGGFETHAAFFNVVLVFINFKWIVWLFNFIFGWS